MTALLSAVLASSLLGSLHCAGMCGGFVALHAGAPGSGRGVRRTAIAHAAYSLGRLLTYATLGAAAGALGATLDSAGALAGIQRLAAVVASVVVVGWGMAGLGRAMGLRLGRQGSGGFLARAAAVGMGVAGGWPVPARALLTGILAGLLPCGWLWAFVVTAAGTAQATTGALVMAVFWAGTIPMLAGVGLLLDTIVGPLRRYLPAATAVAMILVGLLAVAGRAGIGLQHGAVAPTTAVSTGAVPAHGHR
jgi:sulfite exporter TauE/SafE